MAIDKTFESASADSNESRPHATAPTGRGAPEGLSFALSCRVDEEWVRILELHKKLWAEAQRAYLIPREYLDLQPEQK